MDMQFYEEARIELNKDDKEGETQNEELYRISYRPPGVCGHPHFILPLSKNLEEKIAPFREEVI